MSLYCWSPVLPKSKRKVGHHNTFPGALLGLTSAPPGLEELGIFRPYRWAEDANHQRRLIDLFLKSVHTELAPSNTFDHLTDDEGQALFDVGHKPADLFRDELQYANAHDVAGLIKWVRSHFPSC